MALKITQSNLIGFEVIPGDELDVIRAGTGGEDGSGGQIPQTYLPTVYEAVAYSVDLTFQGAYSNGAEPPVYTYEPATLVTTNYNWASVGLTYTQLTTNSVRISGGVTNLFADQYYQFVLPNMDLQILTPDTNKQYYSLTYYRMPQPVTYMKTYASIFATIPPDPLVGGSSTIETVDMMQWVHWSFASAAANIQYLKQHGLR
jgi:hypothetical protein